MDLVQQLNAIQETDGRGFGKITRQRLRQEKRRMQKEKRSQMKQTAMKMKIPGGAAAIRELPEV